MSTFRRLAAAAALCAALLIAAGGPALADEPRTVAVGVVGTPSPTLQPFGDLDGCGLGDRPWHV